MNFFNAIKKGIKDMIKEIFYKEKDESMNNAFVKSLITKESIKKINSINIVSNIINTYILK